MSESVESWKKCSACKTPMAYGAKYYQCSVSTCNSTRTGYAFCSVGCFETHIPGARHKNAAAVEEVAPAAAPKAESVAATSVAPPQRRMVSGGSKPQRRIVSSGKIPSARAKSQQSDEVLIIASRLKDFIREQSEFNTSGSVMGALSHHIRYACLQAIDNARDDGRKTVMEQDFEFLTKVNFNI